MRDLQIRGDRFGQRAVDRRGDHRRRSKTGVLSVAEAVTTAASYSVSRVEATSGLASAGGIKRNGGVRPA